MDPVSSVGVLVGLVSSLFSVGSGAVMQGVMIHQQLHPPAQTEPGQPCTPPYQPTVIIDQGQRKVVCAEAVQP